MTSINVDGDESLPSVPLVVTLPDQTPPTAPTALTATTVRETNVTLTWNRATDNGSVGPYQVFRNGTYLGFTSANIFTDNGVVANTSYSYVVTANDTAGNSTPSSALAVKTPVVGPGSVWKYTDDGVSSAARPGRSSRTTTRPGRAAPHSSGTAMVTRSRS